MDINLDLNSSEFVRIFVNGKLAGEISVQQLDSIAGLQLEVEKARRLEALPNILNSLVEKMTRQSKTAGQKEMLLKGLYAGLNLETKPHPYPGVPQMLPEYDSYYLQGYETGQAIRRIRDSLI